MSSESVAVLIQQTLVVLVRADGLLSVGRN